MKPNCFQTDTAFFGGHKLLSWLGLGVWVILHDAFHAADWSRSKSCDYTRGRMFAGEINRNKWSKLLSWEKSTRSHARSCNSHVILIHKFVYRLRFWRFFRVYATTFERVQVTLFEPALGDATTGKWGATRRLKQRDGAGHLRSGKWGAPRRLKQCDGPPLAIGEMRRHTPDKHITNMLTD